MIKTKPQLKLLKTFKIKINLAVTESFYDSSVTKIVKSLKYSKRGELEITDLNNKYIKNNLNIIYLEGASLGLILDHTRNYLKLLNLLKSYSLIKAIS